MGNRTSGHGMEWTRGMGRPGADRPLPTLSPVTTVEAPRGDGPPAAWLDEGKVSPEWAPPTGDPVRQPAEAAVAVVQRRSSSGSSSQMPSSRPAKFKITTVALRMQTKWEANRIRVSQKG